MKLLKTDKLATLESLILEEAIKLYDWAIEGDNYKNDFRKTVKNMFMELVSSAEITDTEFDAIAKARGYVKSQAPTIAAIAKPVPPMSNSRDFILALEKKLPAEGGVTHAALINMIFETVSELLVDRNKLYLTVPQRRALEEAMQALTVENWTTKQKTPWPDKKNYLCLEAVLREAYDQAAVGKGAVRHADGKPFDKQPMQVINDRTGPGFTIGQVLKKVEEAIDLPYENKVHELLGAINYIAGTIIWLRNNPPAPVDEDEEEF